jgi:hypothetical protein
MTATLCGHIFGDRIPPNQPGSTASPCQRCARTAALHPLDRDPPGYHLTAASPDSGLVTATDPAGRPIGLAGTLGHVRFHAWSHAHTAALATARLRRDSRRRKAADHDAWRVLLPNPMGRRRPAGTIRARDNSFLADLDDSECPATRRFRTRAQAQRSIIEHRVVHGWPPTTWLVHHDTQLLRCASSRHAAARWLRGYHAAFTGLRATAIRPVGVDAYQHFYPDGGVFTVVRATHAAEHGIDPAVAPRYPYDDPPFDEGPSS